MANKKKRPGSSGRRQQPRPRPQATPPPGEAAGEEAEDQVGGERVAAAGNVASGESRPAPPAPTPGVRRRAERLDAGATAPRRPVAKAPRLGSTAAIFEPLPPEDAAIPFDRVPYVPADLRRVGVMAGVMVLLIIVAAIVVNATVK